MKYIPFPFLFACFADSSIKQYNAEPEIQIVSHEDDSIISAGDVSFRALVSDLNNSYDELLVQWLIDNEVVCPATAPSVSEESVCTISIDASISQVQAEVRDPSGAFSFDIISFSVQENRPPTSPNVEISPKPTGSGDTLTLNISGATDPDLDPLSFRSVWFRDGVEYAQSESIPSAVTQKGEVWSVQVYASDGVWESPPAGDSTVIINGAPHILLSIETSGGAYNDSTLSCNATITDPDSDPFTSSYEWSINGIVVGTDPTLELSAAIAHPNDEVICTVTANDTEESSTQQSTITLLNREPIVQGLSLSPSVPYTHDDLTASYTLFDPDMDSINIDISWYVDGILIQSGLDWLSHLEFIRNQVVSVDVTPSDPYGTGYTEQQSVLIQNTPPQGAVIRIDPENPREGVDDLHCILETEPYDADGDAITHHFSWNKNGTPYTGTPLHIDYTGDGISASETTDGDIWECEYEAEDQSAFSSILTTDTEIGPNVCYAYRSHSHEVPSCIEYQNQTQETCVPASGVGTCYPQYCDTGETTQPAHNADGSSTGAYCSNWGQCEGNPNHDVSGQSGWSWVSGYWSCTYNTVTVPVTVYGGANCGYYNTCDQEQVSCGTPNNCSP